MLAFENNIFLYAFWLLLIPIIGALINQLWIIKARKKLGYGERVKNLVQGSSKYRTRIKVLFRWLAFGSMVIALANPRVEQETKITSQKKSAQIVFIIDVSNSMLASDILPNRLTQAKQIISDIAKTFTGEEVGIVVFAGTAQLFLPLTTDYETVQKYSNSISTNLIQQQGTNFRDALELGEMLLKPHNKNTQVLCVISDGESHISSFKGVADSLINKGVYLFSIGVGTVNGAKILMQNPEDGSIKIKKNKDGVPVITKLNEKYLMSLAGNRKDRYFHLVARETTVNKFLTEFHKVNIISKQENTAFQEYYLWFLFLAIIFMFFDLIIPDGRAV